MKKFVGKIYWYLGYYKDNFSEFAYSANVDRAFLDNNVFKIEHSETADFGSGQLILRTKNEFNFDGSLTYIGETKPSATINLEGYWNHPKCLLIRKWIEDSSSYTCILEQEEVQKFK